MGINLGGLAADMPQQRLDVPQISTVFKQMHSKAGDFATLDHFIS